MDIMTLTALLAVFGYALALYAVFGWNRADKRTRNAISIYAKTSYESFADREGFKDEIAYMTELHAREVEALESQIESHGLVVERDDWGCAVKKPVLREWSFYG
jgi:hypothetical protein